ncbi:MMPL family transporter [Bhargavaea ullalensis]|uniref:RND superfamily putative drug exporter n=1 Tax=Bhargavaea ullalensis TaxID=1265685 RepID=A0ABV2GEW1_9BACL
MRGKRRYVITLLIWIVAAAILSFAAPGSKEFVKPNENSGLPADEPSIVAAEKVKEYFPEGGGLPAMGVIRDEEGLTDAEISGFAEAVGAIADDPKFKELKVLPAEALIGQKEAFLSEDGTTFFVPVTLPEKMEGHEMMVLMDHLKEKVRSGAPDGLEINWTGPAGIAADATELFSRADVVLLLSTVGLILVLLLIIYRSPLLAFIPLVGAGIVYAVVDRLIGIGAKTGLFVTESQALSIMMILLFAVITDYSLLIFSRFREELKEHEHPADAMKEAMLHVKEPIFFSGSTIFLAMLTLFASLYEPYRNFAPVFAIAAVAMLAAGLTLLPSLFALAGRKAFWPSIPNYGDEKTKRGKRTIWSRIAGAVTKRPAVFLVAVLALLVLSSLNIFNYRESFDLVKSFPEDLSSRQGYEQLAAGFGEGELAPGTVLVVSDEDIDPEAAVRLSERIAEEPGIERTGFQGHPVSEDGTAARMTVTFKGNPYDKAALDAADNLRAHGSELAGEAGIQATEFHLSGESALNADLKEINDRDTILVMVSVALLIAVMLGFQTKSVVAPLYLIGTLILSYAATLGLSIFLFDVFLGQKALSYRIPLYSFVFLVALGVDYSIMLIARIREEKRSHDLHEAVRLGIERTGGVISSAGIILAATFLVLATMPVNELKLFGMMMALGILIDTFIVRPLLIPAIILLLGKKSGI